MSETNKARIAAIEARNAPDLDEATKAVAWHMGTLERDMLARDLAKAVISTVPGPSRKGDPISMLLTKAHALETALGGKAE